MANKVIITKKPREIFRQDPDWREITVDRNDINSSLLRIIYDIEDVSFVEQHLENQFNFDNRRKNVYFYVNKDIEGLKNFMQHLDYEPDTPEILE